MLTPVTQTPKENMLATFHCRVPWFHVVACLHSCTLQGSHHQFAVNVWLDDQSYQKLSVAPYLQNSRVFATSPTPLLQHPFISLWKVRVRDIWACQNNNNVFAVCKKRNGRWSTTTDGWRRLMRSSFYTLWLQPPACYAVRNSNFSFVLRDHRVVNMQKVI